MDDRSGVQPISLLFIVVVQPSSHLRMKGGFAEYEGATRWLGPQTRTSRLRHACPCTR